MRARNIKPGFFDNEEIGELSVTARLLFIGLWCMADNEGYLEYRPKKIKARLFPYDSFNLIKFLEEVSESGLIIIWCDKESGPLYIEIPNFLKHQRPHPKEKASEISHIFKREHLLIKLHENKLNSRLILGCSDVMNPDVMNEEEDKTTQTQKKNKATLEEATAFFSENGSSTFEAEKFFDHFTSNGWKVGGKTPMKDWQAAARNWIRRSVNDRPKTKHEVNDRIHEISDAIKQNTGFNPYAIIEAGDSGGDGNEACRALPQLRTH